MNNLSPIQNEILSKLKNAKSLRYSELQNKKIPNDLFNYHLQFLVKRGLLTKTRAGYSLSGRGMKHVADPIFSNNILSNLFKINVIMVLSRLVDDKIEILSQERTSNPSYGKVGVPGGVVCKEELIESAAKRKLKQETGLEADFYLVGMERRIMYRGGELFSDVLFPITYSNSYCGELIDENSYGRNFWIPVSKAIKNESVEYDSINGVVVTLKAIKNNSIGNLPFFFKENIQSD